MKFLACAFGMSLLKESIEHHFAILTVTGILNLHFQFQCIEHPVDESLLKF